MTAGPTALLAVLVVALTSLGPLSTDFYLPSLPAIGRALATDSAGVQLTLSVYLLGFGFGQLLLGPLSDVFISPHTHTAPMLVTAPRSTV